MCLPMPAQNRAIHGVTFPASASAKEARLLALVLRPWPASRSAISRGENEHMIARDRDTTLPQHCELQRCSGHLHTSGDCSYLYLAQGRRSTVRCHLPP